MPEILLRNMFKRLIRNFVLVPWVVIGVALSKGGPWGTVMALAVAAVTCSGGVQLPYTMFMVPLSRKQRQDYLRKMRFIVFAFTVAVCAVIGTVAAVLVKTSALTVISICVSGFSLTYAFSYNDYFFSRNTCMQGVLVLFCISDCVCLTMAALSSRDGGWQEDMWILAASILVLLIEAAVLHRYTDDMIHRFSDYEASVNIEKKLKCEK